MWREKGVLLRGMSGTDVVKIYHMHANKIQIWKDIQRPKIQALYKIDIRHAYDVTKVNGKINEKVLG